MITKSKKAVGTVFYVPTTTPEGEAFLGQLKKYLNRGEYRISFRGRNENRAGVARAMGIGHRAFHQDVPLENSTYVAVYISGKTTRRHTFTQIKSLYDRIDKQHDEIERLNRRRQEQALKIQTLETLLQSANKLVEDSRIDADFLRANLKEANDAIRELTQQQPSWGSVWKDIKLVIRRLV